MRQEIKGNIMPCDLTPHIVKIYSFRQNLTDDFPTLFEGSNFFDSPSHFLITLNRNIRLNSYLNNPLIIISICHRSFFPIKYGDEKVLLLWRGV